MAASTSLCGGGGPSNTATPPSLHQGNVANRDDCRRVVHEVIAQHGRLDILVNSAGITVRRLVITMTGEDWDKVIAVNLSGAFHMAVCSG